MTLDKGTTGAAALALAAWSTGLVWAGNDPPFNAELIGTWDGFGGSYADVWGDGSFAYLGEFGDAGVLIVDIADPANPSGVEYLLPPPNQGASAQDIKVHDGLMFVGLESNSDAAVHIVDVRDPLNPLALVDISISGFNQIHNVFYDNGFLYLADSGTPRFGVVDLTTLDPDNPPAGPITTAMWIVGNVGSSFVHDITVVDGRLYASAWDSGLWIYDVTQAAIRAPSFLGQTPDGGNNTHSAWPTANGDYVVTGEERSGGGIKVYRITDNRGSLTLELTDAIAFPPAQAFSVHNPLIVGYRLFNSWYGLGLRVYDIDPDTGLLTLFATYDTPDSVWGVYPFLSETRVLLSERSLGLYIVRVGCPWDLDGDGSVGTADLLVLLAAWGTDPGGDPDFNGDGNVGTADLLELLANWGSC